MSTKLPHVPPAHKLFDHLLSKHGLKNDAALARAINVNPPLISKIRHGRLELSAVTILAIHETFDEPVADIRAMVAA